MNYKRLEFPEDFLWGSAAAAHQTEGGNCNNWTKWESKPGTIKDGSTSEVACDHYNRYKEDFDLAKELGHEVHRFSIEWSRIEPEEGEWDDSEIEHYRNVIQALLDREIQPMVTLHHFTNPIWFSEDDGWLNPSSPDRFGRFVRKAVEPFTDYGIIWNTINEPMVVVTMGYLFGDFPPGLQDYGKALTAAKNLLKAHGQAATAIREVYDEKGMKQPDIAPVLSTSYFEPYDPNNEEDAELAEYLDYLYNHAWLEGVMTSTIPEILGEEKTYKPLEDSADFIGVNYYSRMRVSTTLDFMAGEMPPKDPDLPRCEGLDWEFYPEGYYPILKGMWDKWKTPIFLTENGIGTQDDSLRRRYIVAHLRQVHKAIRDGVEILGYLIWSLTDNFEWAEGYESHFGLVEVDYKTQERIPRESAYMFREIIQENALTSEIQAKHLDSEMDPS